MQPLLGLPYTSQPAQAELLLTLLLRAYFFTVLCTETACCAGKDGVPVMICYTLQPISVGVACY
jgi:hypothetical protein